MKVKRIVSLIFTILFLIGLCSCTSKDKNKDDGGANSSSRYFIKGADISSLEAVEDNGGKFYDFDGNETDVITFLMENGCNYFRLRVWNNPTRSFDAGDYCSPEHTIEMAKRIKEAGGTYLLDFHYSDWWADPENQTVPAEWKGMTEEELVQAVYDFTAEVLNSLAEADAYPDMVQIGNEIGNGMLWDYGSIDNPETLAALLNSGISAVRDTTPKGQDTQIMIHIEDGGSVDKTENFFTTLEANGVTDYDIVGLSYYPYWHGTFAELKENIENIYTKFGKQVVVAETAYPFTYENSDDKRNMVMDADTSIVGFEATEENQRKVFELVMNSVANCAGGLGVFYWEPAWLAVDGVGVAKGSGNEWENQTLFDFEGKALDAIRAFGFEPGSLDNDIPLYMYPLESCDIDINSSAEDAVKELPQTAEVLYSDGSIRDVQIEWDASSRKTITETRVAYTGKAGDFDVHLGVSLVDKYSVNNLGFEEGATGWIISGDTDAAWITNGDDGYPYEGSWSFNYWDAGDFTVDVYQYVKITEDGQYDLGVWSEGKGNTRLLLTLYIADADGKYLDSDSFQNTGWANWRNISVTAGLKEGDIIRIGVKVQGVSDDWGALDGFTFGKTN